MEKKKTSVEFLYEFVLLKLTNEQQMQFEGLFAQAKQMEKEQIKKALQEFLDITLPDEVCDEYYESKYGKDENKAENND